MLSQEIPPSVAQTASYLLKAGEVVTRVGVLVALLWAIYLAAHMAPSAVKGELSFRDVAENLLLIIVNLVCAGVVSMGVEKWYFSAKYRLLGLADLLAGAFTLVTAPLAGVLFVAGGLFFYVAAEMVSVFRVREKLA